MLPINHLINFLAKRRVEARGRRTLMGASADFRQEACGFSNAEDGYTLDDEISEGAFPATVGWREPVDTYLPDYNRHSFLFGR